MNDNTNELHMTERETEALRLRQQGYNCSQCVLMACDDIIGIDREMAARLSAGLGSGVARGEICGVANSLAIAEGFRQGDSTPGAKLKVMPNVKRLCDRFSDPYGGKITCRDLKGKCGRSCEELICEGIRILCQS